MWQRQRAPCLAATNPPDLASCNLAWRLALQHSGAYAGKLKAHRECVTQRNIQGPPHLVVEVLSPSNARKDAVRKRRLYEKFGVPELWLVPEHTDRVEVLRLDGETYGRPLLFDGTDRLTSPLLPRFELPVADLFAASPLEDVGMYHRASVVAGVWSLY